MRKFKYILALALVMMFTAVAQASSSITDNAGLLTQAQIQTLNGKINQLEQEYGIRVGIITQNSIPSNVDVTRACEALRGTKYNILLLIAMDSRQWSVSADEAMLQRINGDRGLKYIQSQVIPKLSAQDYAGAFNGYITAVGALTQGAQGVHNVSDATYGDDGGFDPMAAMIAFALAIFIGVMIRSSLIASMSNVRPALEATKYLDQSSVNIIESRDTFLYMNVNRQPKRGSTSRSVPGGGGGGSHDGGGGSSGGSF